MLDYLMNPSLDWIHMQIWVGTSKQCPVVPGCLNNSKTLQHTEHSWSLRLCTPGLPKLTWTCRSRPETDRSQVHSESEWAHHAVAAKGEPGAAPSGLPIQAIHFLFIFPFIFSFIFPFIFPSIFSSIFPSIFPFISYFHSFFHTFSPSFFHSFFHSFFQSFFHPYFHSFSKFPFIFPSHGHLSRSWA